jgi:phosphate transport system permease protein
MTTGKLLLQSASQQQARLNRYAKRKFVNRIALTLSLMAMTFGLFWLCWILFETVR